MTTREVIITMCNLSKHEFVCSLKTQLIAKTTDIEQRYVATILWNETDVRQLAIKNKR